MATGTHHQIAVMDALFAFHEAMNDGNLSITDLVAVMRQAIESGHDRLELELWMAMVAVQRAKAGEED